MVPGDRSEIAALALALVGLALVASAFQVLPFTTGTEYTYRIEPIADGVSGSDDPELSFESFSEPARSAFRQALDAPDGTVTVRGETYADPGFRYGTDAVEEYVVSHRGTVFEFRPTKDGAFDFGPIVYAFFALFVGAMGITEGISRSADGRRTATSAVAGLVPFLLVGVVQPLGIERPNLGPLGLHGSVSVVLAGALATVPPALAVWVLYGRLSRSTRSG